ncbi:AI-2E family transporter, partial [Pedobacter agri]
MREKLTFLPKLALVLFCLISLTYIAILGQTLLAPLLFSFLMAILLLPVGNFLEQRFRFKRGLSTILAVILMIAVISGIIYFFGNQLSDLWADWPLLKKKANVSYHELQQWISKTFHVNSEKQLAYLND